MVRAQSDALVLFGASGDLAFKKIFPSLYAMARRRHLQVPVIGIGAGPDTNGQILVLYDVLDITVGRKPRFSRNFVPGTNSPLEAIKAYADAVKTRAYPAAEHCF